jgi:protein-L-isoaspartate(D-aspartate) O-methyltransferase
MTDPHLELARQEMIRVQLSRRGIHDRRVLAAMAKVPRERFVGPEWRWEAYADRALGIDCGQTISQPYIVALMTEALELTGTEKVLEIGTGSGYQTAVLAELVAEVISIERHARLSQQAGEMLAELGYHNVRLIVGDGTLGAADLAPFFRILVAAAGAECPPALWDQLDEGGALVMPIGPLDQQVLQVIRKLHGKPVITNLAGCRFVPLVGNQGWPEEE